MKKIVLSIEQMKQLESLGLNISDASMYWYKTVNAITSEEYYELQTNNGVLNNWEKKKEFNPHIIPAYTLQDILEKLPQKIYLKSNSKSLDDIAFFTMNKMAGGGYFMAYEQSWDNEDGNLKIVMHGKQQYENVIDAAYNILVWCIENKHIIPIKHEI